MNSLFLAHQHSLSPGGGGQQQCTREYRDVLLAAGFDLVDTTFATDRSWKTRLKRKFFPAPYSRLIPEEFFSVLNESVREKRPAFVFCNLCNFISCAQRLRKELPTGSKLVLLSHGLASVDEIHAARIARQNPVRLRQISDEWIGAMLRVESEGLPEFDHVFCLAPFEVEICRWLGARSVSWLPRIVPQSQALKWEPIPGRLGCVSTIDHPPNWEGLEKFLGALEQVALETVRFRLVGGPVSFGDEISQRFKMVDYLGPLDDDAVRAEAQTWQAFVHPLFCYARGCSTKLAVALSWQIPVVTTPAGARGYCWRHGKIPMAETPTELAALAISLSEPSTARAFREQVEAVAESSPTIEEVALELRSALLSVSI